ncbi:MAG: gliding motility-associated ABC transporter ATP-binding subunit GldA [Flavobacteriales bacterium]|jgi:ABC-2 type transport system ATP-binding protein|nr:gliding motility-associated ABC transporter ATP-binding subunit GldA [Flavobacteriales bacterium]MDC0459832.1 gliding motility-associated ABC transporter ATP-binding subunit GldA [Crocinitomicaceae bacterium]MDO7610632.1 gliding motility-associated ABC transporter ATP-binding subunit GldA [Crocinitomicaceae bacterium]
MSIEVKNVFKYFGEQAAVKDISFSVNKGEIVGFLGPNGAGKSTTMRMITGFLPVSSGEIYVSGLKVGTDNLKAQQKIGYLPENNPLYVDMYVKEYLEFVGRIYKVPKLKNRIKEMIDAVGLEVEQHKKIGALSKGYRQRVGLAQAIIHDPEVLILDEPTSGLDPNQLVEIRELIKTIGKEKTLMLSTHIMQEAEAICDKIVIISKGEIVTNKTTAELQKDASGKYLFVEFQQEISKSQLKKVKGVDHVEEHEKGFLLKGTSMEELKINVSRFAQENNMILMTLKSESKSLEEIFKDLTV